MSHSAEAQDIVNRLSHAAPRSATGREMSADGAEVHC